MNMFDLKPAKEFALNYGVKTVVYGPPGAGKTPVCTTGVSRPLLLLSEPGVYSIRQSEVPTFPAFTSARIDEFFLWFMNSAENKNFDTLIWDSPSQAMEIYVDEAISGKSQSGNKKHGLEAYGIAGNAMMRHLSGLYFMPAKHVILICKQEIIVLNSMNYMRPYFAGQMLPIRVPHLYDLITRLGKYTVPGVIGPTTAFRTMEDFNQMGRDRSGNLNEFEPPNMSALIAKFMA